MLHEDLIQKWLDEGTIDQSQALKMRADLSAYTLERRSKKRISAFSIIGVLLIGIGAFLFVASNWEKIGDIFRVLLLVGSTLCIYFAGYRLRCEKEKYARIGLALIFLSALLFGASLFLIAQIYNINANESTLVLIWILGVFPLVYGYQSPPIAGLCAIMFYLWIGFLYDERTDLHKFIEIGDLYLISGIGLYFVGLLHGLAEKTRLVSLPLKFMGLQASLLVLFIYTFPNEYVTAEKIVPAVYALLGVIFLAAIMLLKPLRVRFSEFHEDLSMPAIALLMAGITLTKIYTPASDKTYMVVFNIIFLGLLILLLYAGYSRENFRTIYTAVFWFILLIFARYFDFFWGLLPRSIFFALGGLILLVMSVIMERKRRELKVQFTGENGGLH